MLHAQDDDDGLVQGRIVRLTIDPLFGFQCEADKVSYRLSNYLQVGRLSEMYTAEALDWIEDAAGLPVEHVM